MKLKISPYQNSVLNDLVGCTVTSLHWSEYSISFYTNQGEFVYNVEDCEQEDCISMSWIEGISSIHKLIGSPIKEITCHFLNIRKTSIIDDGPYGNQLIIHNFGLITEKGESTLDFRCQYGHPCTPNVGRLTKVDLQGNFS